MLVKTKAIVISALKYGEADLIVKIYTESDGLKTYLLRGILKSRKGKLRTAMFQPATQLEIEANHKNKGNLESIREAKVLHPYTTLHTDISKTGIVMFLSEMLRGAIQEEEANPALYAYLENAFLWLDHHAHVANFHLLFLLKLTRYLGFYPDENHEELPFFNMETGMFQEHDEHYCIEGDSLQLLKKLMVTGFDGLTALKLNHARRNAFVETLLLYFDLHLQGFKRPRSLEILSGLYH
ncbi:MAG: DNA repair protein RecO [Cytophagaceae bacterium]|nr:DNA repair protein RecO [Cytophagaceae bacterium]|tara:strand:+ start:36832 stop:37548 length:717 start_codon:yes stop_codon:yes gene_type:complete